MQCGVYAYFLIFYGLYKRKYLRVNIDENKKTSPSNLLISWTLDRIIQ